MTTLKYLERDEDERALGFYGVLGRSASMRELFATLKKVAPTDLTCLIEGETGTGKERVARAIHGGSARAQKPYIVLDCSAIPATLVESYLFGHEKGAFTGAEMSRKGVFEQAQGGTLFLDEIGELDLDMQPKLLRVLENCEFKRVGGSRTIRTDCRIVAASNRALGELVEVGLFRQDLYFRLSIIRVALCPLRERREDIGLLAAHFLGEFGPERGRAPRHLSPGALEVLQNYGWPGNIRELKNVIARAASLCERAVIEARDLRLGSDEAPFTQLAPPASDASDAHDPPGEGRGSVDVPVDLGLEYKDARAQLLAHFERAYLERVLRENAFNISKSARSAGISRYYLHQLLKKHGLN